MQLTRRKLLTSSGKLALGAGLSGPLLAACSAAETTGEQTAGQEDEAVVTYWTSSEGAEGQQYFEDNVRAPFEEDHPNIQLNVTFEDSTELERVIRTAVQAGEGPDLIQSMAPVFARELAEEGILLDLGPYAEQHGWNDVVLDWALGLGRMDDALYFLPGTFEALVLYRNETLFEEHGWQVPTNRDELEALAEEMQGLGIVPFSAGSADFRGTIRWYDSLFWNHVAGPDNVYQALTGQLPWTADPLVEAVEVMRRYFQNGWFGGGVQSYFATPSDAVSAQLGSGEAAMNMAGTWALATIGEFFGEAAGNDNEWNWSPFPSLGADVPSPLFPVGVGSTLSINAQSSVADAAAEYMTWFYTGTENAAERIADMPSQYNIPIDLEQQDLPERMDPRAAEVFTALSGATDAGGFGYVTWTFWPPRSNEYAYEGMERVLLDQLTPQEFSAELDRIFQEELAEGSVPPPIPRDA